MAISLQSSFKLLEINIISAQDLPPVSKMLRTFAVAYVTPDHKLTTKVDHQGHTNPRWNYKIAFHVDEKFLKQESSAITIEIFNVAWLRDLPIGTTRLLINNLSPPLLKNQSFRKVALKIRRPSGHLRGTLNVGIQLIDNTVPDIESNISTIRNEEQINEEDYNQDQNQEENDYSIKEETTDSRKQIEPLDEDSNSPTLRSKKPDRPEPEPETRTVLTSNGSHFSTMRPLPSEVAEDMKKGLYSTEWNEYGSSIFENWTEQGDTSKDERHGLLRTNSLKWRAEDQIPLRSDKKSGPKHKRSRSEGGNNKGLMSCFGNAYGFEFSFICGSKTMKKKKNRNIKQNLHLIPEENLHRLYV
ncbi:hypothetical protein ACJIZ3_022958 [Penstemon smallii]|uniref:C2 domain-containing protein n=1 Tax=Penstemon smallii TaxID=265156 RepID=A0ABD3TMQ6_9LAMI